MSDRSRRAFLTSVGAASVMTLAGCAGTHGEGETSSETTEQHASTSNTTKTTSDASRESQRLNRDTFENLGVWSATGDSTLKKGKKGYEGSQSAHVLGSSRSNVGEIFRADGPVDLTGKNISLMYKCTSHQFSKIAVNLYAPDRGHIVELKRTLYGPKDRWVRVNLGVTNVEDQKNVDLSQVFEIHITGRPVDTQSTRPVDFFVDDLKTVSPPKRGKVMLTFDDGAESHYTKAHSTMKKYGFSGVEAIIPPAIDTDGYLTQNQMREMVGDGWNMIAHPNTQAMPMDKRPAKEQERLMMEAKNWLKKYGYDGHKYMAVPKNVVGADTFDLAMKHFDVSLSFGASPNALPAVTENTILSRAYGTGKTKTTKEVIDHAAHYNQLSILLFHEIGGDGFSEKKFESILDYIDRSRVDVVTMTDLEERGLFI
ncbi:MULTISPECIES: polysaccharide deacetylase family protein [unclassified Haladaptatus]|uniref:polysaccharide deacetylase family protein n=1 Tax=unclassified Haladaptatus TaxID=2622732 RepID=UPI00209BCC8F|nr:MULTISPECIES: polysaccharide deacetylase family protein [unclassified Haladaptatus]MCO8244848.1 polysaccharide deacetylase family protein [Haladaptatus sp. AB643]MCO8255638.1 polysaccharide deacetylase family protein [Haladaptatus sp. AB618]